MYFEVEDYRPDTPRTPSVISVREGVLLSIIVHLVAVVAILLAPKSFFEAAAHLLPVQDEPIRFVSIQPKIDRPALPRPEAPQSDQDRRAAMPDPPPKPQTPEPLSRGDTPEKIEGARVNPEKAMGAESSQPTPKPPDLAAKVIPDITPLPDRPNGSLGDKLRNLKKYIQGSNFDNPKGGQTSTAPDIQFDSKGVDFGPWIARFRAQVMSNWNVPENAAFQKGHVVLQFNVHRDGTITDLRIIQASTYESFTTSSFNAMKTTQLQRTQPLPAEYPTDVVLFTVTFFYNERQP